MPNYDTGISYILRASRHPCGTYKAGWWLCTPSDSELGTWSLGLGVPLGSAEHSGWVAGDLRGTLDVDPNPNGILPLQRQQKKDQRMDPLKRGREKNKMAEAPSISDK